MNMDDEMREIFDKLRIFEKAYDLIRFVDPISKKTFNYKNNTITELEIRCFDFWGRNKMCDNCASIRAFNENQTIIKLEYTQDMIYMITAIPFELSDKRIVIELMKDATNSIIFGAKDGTGENKSEIFAMIENMNNLALKDALTGLYNRRYINEKLPIDLINSALMDQSLSVIMGDIDFFKKVNDTYGHLFGDCVLKSFADTLSGCIKRESDWVARFGGEEFLICLPGASLGRAVKIAESMRKSVEEKNFLCGENHLKITSSFGVYNVKSNQGNNVEGLIKCVDEKLYLAKNNGRNRIEY